MNLILFLLASLLLISPAFAGDLDSLFRTDALTSGSTGQSEPGFDEKYQRDYNIFAPTNQLRPDNPFNPINSVDAGNPANPINRYNPNNPFNPINEVNPDNPLNPINRYNPNIPFEPLNGD